MRAQSVMLVMATTAVGLAVGQLGAYQTERRSYSYGAYSPSYYTSYSSRGSSPYRPNYFDYGFPDEREIYPEWFDVDEPEQCEEVPDAVNTGKPKDLCLEAAAGDRFCICVKRRRYSHSPAAIYQPVCGECRDPCALRFVPDRYPKKATKGEEEGGEE